MTAPDMGRPRVVEVDAGAIAPGPAWEVRRDNADPVRWRDRWEADAYFCGLGAAGLPAGWEAAGDEARLHRTRAAYRAGLEARRLQDIGATVRRGRTRDGAPDPEAPGGAWRR